MDAEVALEDALDEALSVAACRGAQRGLRGKAQLGAPEVGERHQVAHIVVASAPDTRVSEVELRHIAQSLQDVWGHSGVEDYAYRLATLAALDPARDLLDDTGA